ncbi:MAG: amino acid ABC transporter permease [Dongiaceae bacterium]
MAQLVTVDAEQRVAWWRDERKRGIVAQIVTLSLVFLSGGYLIHNMVQNQAQLGVPLGLDFLDDVAGFPISESLIPYSLQSSNFDALIVGILNTLLVAVICIPLATIVGFVIGVCRLSSNKLVAGLATVYIETLRNIPLLVQILFWYNGVLQVLPNVKQSHNLFDAVFLNIRGLYVPKPVAEDSALIGLIALVIGIVGAIIIARWAKRRQDATGQQFPKLSVGIALIVGLPLLASVIFGNPVSWNYAVLQGFNFQGGMVLSPELTALCLGLSIYTSAFIAENVRAGIQAVSHGQTEAAEALGLRNSWTLRLVIIPQAMRVVVPPLTSQYLNIVKNSTLAAFMGYPDLVSIFTSTVQNQTGRAVECIAITMLFYLTVSLAISLFMNWYNKRIALVER